MIRTAAHGSGELWRIAELLLIVVGARGTTAVIVVAVRRAECHVARRAAATVITILLE